MNHLNLRRFIRTFLWRVIKPQQTWLWLAVGAVVAAAMISTFSSYIFKFIVDAVESGNVSQALVFGLAYPIVVLLIQLLYRLSGYGVAQLTVRSAKVSTDVMLEHLFQHSHAYFTNRFAGSVTNKIRNVTGALEQIIPDVIWGQLDTLVTFLVTFIIIGTVSPAAAVAFLFLVFSLLLLNGRMAPEKARLAKQNAAAGTELQGRAVDAISNMAAVRQYVRQQHELAGLTLLTEKKQRTGLANWLYTEKMLLINAVIIFLFNAVIFYLLVEGWRSGALSSGDFVLILALVTKIVGTMLFIGRAVNATARAFGELKEGLEDVYEPYSLLDMPGAKPLVVSAGEIRFAGVNFDYDGKPVFRNFDLTIPSKQKIGLVGTSGAGKTTFVSLLLREHERKGGLITIDAEDISAVTQASLREAIAVVPQEPILFHRSIYENIAYGKPEATKEEVERAATLAHAHEFITDLSEGYETLVGERGVKLSGGQKQRIAIARAMLKDAPILILDEATSALDSESEQLIQKALHTLMEGKTVIAIAHRLSTLKEMDRIIVLQGGAIAEDGTHEELARGTGTYARLWTHQAGGFLPE